MTKVIFQIGFLAPHCVSAFNGFILLFFTLLRSHRQPGYIFSVFKSNTSQNSSPRSDEGLTLKTSALETF